MIIFKIHSVSDIHLMKRKNLTYGNISGRGFRKQRSPAHFKKRECAGNFMVCIKKNSIQYNFRFIADYYPPSTSYCF